MNKIRLVAGVALVAVAAMGLSGCTTGAFAKLQSADEALAAKYGIPVSVVQGARKALGIPDARTIPDSSRVLPAGWMVYYDVLDATGGVVNVTGYHYSDVPKVRQVTTEATSVFTPAPSAESQTMSLEALLNVIKANPDLLKPAK